MNRLKWFFMSGRKKLLYIILCAKANEQRLYLENGVTLDFTRKNEDKYMKYPEDIRKEIIEALFNNPKLGENYIDWHTESGECGVTIIYKNANQKFDIIIRPREEETK